MFTVRRIICKLYSLCLLLASWSFVIADDTVESAKKYEEGQAIASGTVATILNLFYECVGTTMPNQEFALDNLQRYIYSPAKTTVGFAPKFTSNRKFFANMLASQAFKEMLAQDEEELRKDQIRKLKFCCTAVMDQKILRDLYDREVDQSKLR